MKKYIDGLAPYAPAILIPFVISLILAYFNPILGFLGVLASAYVTYHIYQSTQENKQAIEEYIENLGTNLDKVAKNAVFNMPFAMAMVDEKGDLIWYNTRFADISQGDEVLGQPLEDAIPNLSVKHLKEGDDPLIASVDGLDYIFYYTIQRDDKNQKAHRVLLYGLNYTKEKELQDAYHDESLVVGLLFLDNYDEIRQGALESERNIIFANIDNMMSEYFGEYFGIVRKYESDKYLVILQKEQMDVLTEKRFDILDRIKQIKTGEKEIAPSLSIGMGVDGENPHDSYIRARTAIDVALGRGGDQCVVKNDEGLHFYGGKHEAVDKRTKVKSRVIAHAMQQLIDQSSDVFVMGHKNADMDSFGSAVGVLAAVRSRNKKGYFVLNELNPSITEIAKAFEDVPTDVKPQYISGDDAVDKFKDNSLLIVVDTHRKASTEEPRLLDMAERLVLLDHHRRGADYIEDPTLTYLEPYASSTSELVTEMLQYMDDSMDITEREAGALLAGIMVDTKNFYYQTGVRTFEAASLLKRAGADSMEVKRFFKDGFDTYTAKAGVIKNTRILDDHIAIGRLYGVREDGILIAAQSADDLLGIRSIDASFVLTELEEGTHLSARSLGSYSVQIIAEKLGGGGHQTSAGAQFKGKNLDEVEQMLIQAIREYESEDTKK